MRTYMLGTLVFLSASCACFRDPTKAKEPGCVFTKTVVDCTKKDIAQQVPNLAPVITWVLQGAPQGVINWNEYLTNLGATVGLELLGCTAEQLQAAFNASVTRMGAQPGGGEDVTLRNNWDRKRRAAVAVQNNWGTWKASHLPDVKFTLPSKNEVEKYAP